MSRPRVGVDATSLGAYGKGVARYARELLPALAALDAPVDVVALLSEDAELPVGAELLESVRARVRPAVLWEQLGVPRTIRRERLSLVHTTSDRLPLRASAPLVLYLFEDPKYRLAAAKGERSVRGAVADALTGALHPRSLARAALVLVSSEATARDVRLRGVPDSRIRLVYPGVSSDFRPIAGADERARIRARLGAPNGYVLHFSSDDPRDNTPVVLRAYAQLRRRLPDAPPLLVAGPVAGTLARRQAEVAALGIEGHVRWAGFQRSDTLGEVYRAASAYVDPSLYEGFGFQVAEALASGLPVVCSNTTSLPEVVGDAGILLDPGEVNGFAAALERILDPEVGAELGRRGAARAVRFAWSRTAEETVQAWLDVLSVRSAPRAV